MIRLSGSDYQGQSIADILHALSTDPAHSYLSKKPLLIVLNGKLIQPRNYHKAKLCENDIVTIMPFMAGG